MKKIVIYADDGVGAFGLACLRNFFAGEDVALASANDILGGAIFRGRDLFVMPGGADLPYCRKLNGAGNDNIRAFVAAGGTYLGICAGAYYGCAAIEFHKGRADEIAGPRELAFSSATACGSLGHIAGLYDETLLSAEITEIALPDGRVIEAFYHGGPAFRGSHTGEVAGRFMGDNQPAILSTPVSSGRAVLSGVHLEVTAAQLPLFPVRHDGETACRDRLSKRLAAAGDNAGDYLRELLRG